MPKKTILLVEDERITAVLEAKMLRKAGYDVICECCGEDAIDRVNKTPGIDLILMDIDLGAGVDGTAAAEMILKSNDIPVVFLSAHTEPEVVEKTENITSYGYVVKYTGETVLLASLKMAFKLHFAHRELSKNRLDLSGALEEQRKAEKIILQQKMELEKTNEELLKANQELTAANEEFEAMNEELVRSQDELIRSEMKFKGVVENSPSGIHLYELTSEGSLIFTGANKSADRILGVDNSMFIGKTIEEAFPPLA
ncbi:MAG TPA: response regulator, partial [Spirochaetota bacterium]|nr:response regulator [Spirochaetota bacterium]